MPPAKPASKTSSRKNGTFKQGSSKKGAAKLAAKKAARCHTCGARIRIPDGWTVGPAVRRHYWAKHRTVMQRGSKGSR